MFNAKISLSTGSGSYCKLGVTIEKKNINVHIFTTSKATFSYHGPPNIDPAWFPYKCIAETKIYFIKFLNSNDKWSCFNFFCQQIITIAKCFQMNF